VAGTERHELVQAARVRAELTVSELWLRYVALGGNGDLFDVDAYLSGLLPLGPFDQDVLAVAVNERLEEVYRAARVPLATPTRDREPAEELRAVIAALLDSTGPHRTSAPPPSNDPPPAPESRMASQEEPGGTA
jgi:hypothetical protein